MGFVAGSSRVSCQTPKRVARYGRLLLPAASLFTVCLALAAGASSARAYCRESLDSQSQGPCVDDPNAVPLFWDRSCVTYVFNQDVFKRLSPQLDEQSTRAIFNTSYQTWADVMCGTRKPFYVEQSSRTTATSKAEFLYDVPNESIVVVRSRTEWASLEDHDSNALALTLLWHDKHTGEILDVDMELNGGAGTFTDCVKQHCVSSMIDLQNTVTHEAGHLLGLGHSTVIGATMQASTSSSPETSKRDLAPDDQMGYCALNLPEWKCTGASCMCPTAPVYPSKKTTHSCSCATVGAETSGGWSALALAAAASGWRLRRRQRPNANG